MPESVKQALKRVGPCLTSDLIQEFVSQGMSDVAARKKISRSQDDYKRLAGLRFTKNARFIYLDQQFGDEKFWEGLERAFKKSGKSYWCAWVGLRGRGGSCLKDHFPIVSGAPLARKSQMSPERILERLSAIQLLKTITDDSGVTRIEFVPHEIYKQSEAVMNAILLAESIAIRAVVDWARRLGLGSYGKFHTRADDPKPVVSSVVWDISAPSYIRPLVRISDGKAKPGFFVCDVNLNDAINADYVEMFIRKHDMASAPLGVGPIMPMLIGEVFTEEAFSLAKRKGILATTIENLFGKEVAKALHELIKLLSDLGARAAVDPTKIQVVMDTLSKIEGAATNVRSSLFEVVIGSLVKDIEGGFLTIGEKVRHWERGEAEIDVQLRRDDKSLLVIECKSKIPGARVTLAEVQHWLENRVPLIYSILSDDGYSKNRFNFEIWSNGPFNDDAVEWLEAKAPEINAANLGAFTVGWKTGDALKSYSQAAHAAVFRKILRNHYFNHPLSKAARERREQI